MQNRLFPAGGELLSRARPLPEQSPGIFLSPPGGSFPHCRGPLDDSWFQQSGGSQREEPAPVGGVRRGRRLSVDPWGPGLAPSSSGSHGAAPLLAHGPTACSRHHCLLTAPLLAHGVLHGELEWPDVEHPIPGVMGGGSAVAALGSKEWEASSAMLRIVKMVLNTWWKRS